MSINIPELLKAIKEKGFNAEIIAEDYDDYGYDYGIWVNGKCANIRMLEDRHNAALICTVVPKKQDAENSPVRYAHSGVMGGFAESKHFYEFVLKNQIDLFSADTAAEALDWLAQVESALVAGSELFYRVDAVMRGDLSGEFKHGNGLSSYDLFRIADDNFHTLSIIIDFDKSEKQFPAPSEDLSEIYY